MVNKLGKERLEKAYLLSEVMQYIEVPVKYVCAPLGRFINDEKNSCLVVLDHFGLNQI